MKESIDEAKIKQYLAERRAEFRGQLDTEKAWVSIEKRIRKRHIRRWSVYVGCCIALALVTVGILNHAGILPSQPAESLLSSSEFPEKNENKAFLVLADGSTVTLDTCRQIVNRGHCVATNDAKGILNYQTTTVNNIPESARNTLVVPRGGAYQLYLSDGTQVWLNSESSLNYPATFGNSTREVKLVGEAYFEVAEDAEHPFIVHTDKQSVTVMGTKFNLSAYPNAPTLTTLSEGKVCIKSGRQEVSLSPNQQAILADDGSLTRDEADAETYISWIHGVYEFNHVSLQDIVSQLSRWYDVDIRFRNEAPKHKYFTGAISRKDELGFAIEIIQSVSNVTFRREGETIFIE